MEEHTINSLTCGRTPTVTLYSLALETGTNNRQRQQTAVRVKVVIVGRELLRAATEITVTAPGKS